MEYRIYCHDCHQYIYGDKEVTCADQEHNTELIPEQQDYEG